MTGGNTIIDWLMCLFELGWGQNQARSQDFLWGGADFEKVDFFPRGGGNFVKSGLSSPNLDLF